MIIRAGLTFDDVLLVPKHSKIKSRSKDVDLSVQWKRGWGNLKFAHPIIPANMQTVVSPEVAYATIASGGLSILHRFMPLKEQLLIAEDLVDNFSCKSVAVSVGVKETDRQAISNFRDIGVDLFCIDIAHGDSDHCSEMIEFIKSVHKTSYVIAGNVATGDGARRLWKAGADMVKVGIGGGSLCTTRIATGNGVPQLTALMDVAEVQKSLNELERASKTPDEPKRQFPFISDGGIKNSGDIVKALTLADMVMVGNLFAGCEEAPGHTIHLDGKMYKEYVGSSTHKTTHVEGVAALVPCKGKFQDLLSKLIEGLQSGCSYQGSHNLTELKDDPQFIQITGAGLRESHPHDIIMV